MASNCPLHLYFSPIPTPFSLFYLMMQSHWSSTSAPNIPSFLAFMHCRYWFTSLDSLLPHGKFLLILQISNPPLNLSDIPMENHFLSYVRTFSHPLINALIKIYCNHICFPIILWVYGGGYATLLISGSMTPSKILLSVYNLALVKWIA